MKLPREPSFYAVTPFVTASPPICLKTGRTSGQSKSCSATRTFLPPWFIHMSWTNPGLGCAVRSTTVNHREEKPRN